MKLSLSRVAVVVVAALLVMASTACKNPPMGSCEVVFDIFGSSGEACTVVRETECKDEDVSPPIASLASNKKKAFTPGTTCESLGYRKAGCSDIPIAWSFKKSCPKG